LVDFADFLPPKARLIKCRLYVSVVANAFGIVASDLVVHQFVFRVMPTELAICPRRSPEGLQLVDGFP